MTKFRNINILSISALIPLICAFIFPFLTYQSEYYVETLFWIWGLPFYSSPNAIILMIPFMLLSIGILVVIILFLKSCFILLRDNTKIEVVSRDWIKIGRNIIRLEFLWIICLLFLVYFLTSDGRYFIELPFFLPLIGGTMLIIAGNLSRRLDIDNDRVLHKESKFKAIHRLYIFVFILYSIFFSIFFVFFIIFPSNFLEYVQFSFLLYGLYYIYPLLLTLLIMKFDTFLGNIKISDPHERKQLNKIYIMTLVIIGILILIYFLLRWIRPMFEMFFNGNGVD